VERWEVRDRHGDVSVEDWEVTGAPGEEERKPPAGEHLVLMGVRRGPRALLMHRDLELAAGDRVAVAIHEPEREAAERHLRWRGLEPTAREPEAEAGTETG